MGPDNEFVRAEIIAAVKGHFYNWQNFYAGREFEEVSAIYQNSRDVIVSTIDDFVSEQDKQQGITIPREMGVIPPDNFSPEDFELLQADPAKYLDQIAVSWERCGYNAVQKPEWRDTREPFCDNRDANRTVYDFNVNLVPLQASAPILAGRIRALPVFEFHAETPEGVAGVIITTYENILLSRTDAI